MRALFYVAYSWKCASVRARFGEKVLLLLFWRFYEPVAFKYQIFCGVGIVVDSGVCKIALYKFIVDYFSVGGIRNIECSAVCHGLFAVGFVHDGIVAEHDVA